MIDSLQHLMDLMKICAWCHFHFVSNSFCRQKLCLLIPRKRPEIFSFPGELFWLKILWSAIYQTSFDQWHTSWTDTCLNWARVYSEGWGTISGSPSIVLLSSLEQLRWGGSAETGWDWNTRTESLGILHCYPFLQTVSLLSFASCQ